MNRREKIALLKGIIKGETTIHDAMEPRFVIAEVDSDTGELKPYKASTFNPDPESVARNAELIRLAATDPSITVVKIIRE